MIAALYVARGGVYFGLPGVDPWDEARDARLYAGPWPVVAHPPCARWCQLAGLVQARYGFRVGDDDGCFAAALDAVRRWGGVLEHPAYSLAWDAFDLPRPSPGGWQTGLFDPGWVTQVTQSTYGHAARKATWLYYVGPEPPEPLDWTESSATAICSTLTNHRGRLVERLGHRERSATPIPFRDLLIQMAATARPPVEAS